MKHFFTSVVITGCLASAALAGDMITKTVPLDADKSVVWQGAACPVGYVCLDEAEGQATLENAWKGGSDPDYVVPQWGVMRAQAAVTAGQLSETDLGPYLEGMSDKGIVDTCAICGCCIITHEPAEAVPFDLDLLGLE